MVGAAAPPAVSEQLHASNRPTDPRSSERLRTADSSNLDLRSQVATLTAESSQLQSSTALESIAAEREAENEALRSQLMQLTQEVAQNTGAI